MKGRGAASHAKDVTLTVIYFSQNLTICITQTFLKISQSEVTDAPDLIHTQTPLMYYGVSENLVKHCSKGCLCMCGVRGILLFLKISQSEVRDI